MVTLLRRSAWALAGAACLSCAEPAPLDLPIGVLALMSGQLSEASGIPTVQGAELALALDSAGGRVVLDGRVYQVRLVFREHADRPDAATTAARALITQDNVIAIIGPQLSRHAIPAAVIAENAQVPLISPMSSAPATTAGRAWAFRLAYLDDAQGKALARHAFGELRARRAVILYEASSEYSTGVAEVFSEEFERLGGTVIVRERFTSDTRETSAQLRRLRSAAPDVLLLPTFPMDAQRQIPALRAAGITATLLAGDSWDLQVLQTWPGAQESYIAHQWSPDIPLPATAAFVTAFTSRYGTAPRATAAMTFDATGVVIDALRRAGRTDPTALRDALTATSGYRGATGIIRFAGRHDPDRSVVISVVRDSAVRLVRVLDPE